MSFDRVVYCCWSKYLDSQFTIHKIKFYDVTFFIYENMVKRRGGEEEEEEGGGEEGVGEWVGWVKWAGGRI